MKIQFPAGGAKPGPALAGAPGIRIPKQELSGQYGQSKRADPYQPIPSATWPHALDAVHGAAA